MQYSEFHPGPPLSRFVECVWTLSSPDPVIETHVERILPDGCVELILNFGSRITQHTDFKTSIQPRNFLVGQMTGPILISPAGDVDLLGIRFRPGGAFPFLRIPMSELTDQVIELGSLSCVLEHQLLSACHLAAASAARVEAVVASLAASLPLVHDVNLIAMAELVVDSGGVRSVDHLAQDAGISCRQLERRFLQGVGLGPKVLSRILRFQQVFQAVERADNSWAAVALECGYYDQAHLIRDFNQFAGQSPKALLAEFSPLTESFTRKSRTSHFSNTSV
ncbi:MAG TPA: AraC family transcriptional regulator [Pyrinomonadaceae bacterium]|nr:AraC family transcriptional regulator [Pyrinomonadaceae bacterium]